MLNNNLNLAEHYLNTGDLSAAELVLAEILEYQSHSSPANFLMGIVQLRRNNIENSIKFFSKVDDSKINIAEIWYQIGSYYLEIKKFESAIEFLLRSVKVNEIYFEAHHDLGVALSSLGKYEKAITYYLKAEKINQNSPELNFNLGRTYDGLREYENAIKNYEKAIELRSDFVDAWFNKGCSLNDLGCYEAAITAYDRALMIDPKFAKALSNKAVTLFAMGQHQRALDLFDESFLINPEDPDALWNYSIANLRLENYTKGWECYEYRWQKQDPAVNRYKEIPRLISLDNALNKTVLVWWEQGYGDTIQFSRYVEKLSPICSKLIFEVQPVLKKLMGDIACDLVISSQDSINLNLVDFQIPLLSLPLLFGTEKNSIPSKFPYLWKENSQNRSRNNESHPGSKKKIGLTVSGTSGAAIPLKLFSNLIKNNRYSFHLIQKELCDEDQTVLKMHPELEFLGPNLLDFSNTEEILHEMDCIVSIDTSVAHLAGAMSKRVFILLPLLPDWRWQLQRSDSPWYPTAVLIRQQEKDKWKDVMEILENELMLWSFN